MQKLILLLGCLALISCGNLNEKFGRLNKKGNLLIAHKSGSRKNLLSGGILVYIKGTGGNSYKESIYLSDEDQTKNVSVPTGEYKIYGVGWSTGLGAGTAYCGTANNGNDISVNGNTEVDLSISESSCLDSSSNSVFNDAGKGLNVSNTAFASLNVTFCNGISVTPGCNTIDSAVSGKYVKIYYDIYNYSDADYEITDSLSMGCHFLNAGSASTGLLIPLGSSDSNLGIFGITMTVHTDSSCTSVAYYTVHYHNGISQSADSGASSSAITTGSGIASLYVDGY